MATNTVLHSNHYGESLLYDGCNECYELSTHIYNLNNDGLKALAKLEGTRGLSINESRAITYLRLYQNTIERAEYGPTRTPARTS